jgi:O-acetyl-ADP-ribose deacetylase
VSRVDTLAHRRPMSESRAAGPRIVSVLGDITRERVDAIVNAANERLAGGGGVDGAIHATAGWEELTAACAALGGCEVGDAKVTPGFGLSARFIIHTVGPRWSGGARSEPELLASCYRSCLAVADEIGATSLAFPAISTGVFAFPPDRAAAIAVETLVTTPTAVALIHLVAFDPETSARYDRLLAARS